jgi:hypothetical protein
MAPTCAACGRADPIAAGQRWTTKADEPLVTNTRQALGEAVALVPCGHSRTGAHALAPRPPDPPPPPATPATTPDPDTQPSKSAHKKRTATDQVRASLATGHAAAASPTPAPRHRTNRYQTWKAKQETAQRSPRSRRNGCSPTDTTAEPRHASSTAFTHSTLTTAKPSSLRGTATLTHHQPPDAKAAPRTRAACGAAGFDGQASPRRHD